MTEKTKIYKLVQVEETPADGNYSGSVSGYMVEFKVGAETYRFEADRGIRGFNVHCSVNVANGIPVLVKF